MQKQVDGFLGASYKGFASRKDTEDFLEISSVKDTTLSVPMTKVVQHSEAVAYVDGSYDDTAKTFAYGVVIFYNEIEEHFSAKLNTPELLAMHNIAGEIKAAEKAMQFCVDHNIKNIDIYHDYEGIAK